jgi:uncharacterized protein YqeY
MISLQEEYVGSQFKEKFNDLLHDSMRNHDDIARDTMRVILTSLKLAEVEKKAELDDAAVLALVQKEIKTRHESILDFQKGNRQDLVEKTEKEIKVLEQFLPKQLSDEELITIVKAAIQETNAIGMADMGKVMKLVIPQVQGKASSDRISVMVKESLQK